MRVDFEKTVVVVCFEISPRSARSLFCFPSPLTSIFAPTLGRRSRGAGAASGDATAAQGSEAEASISKREGGSEKKGQSEREREQSMCATKDDGRKKKPTFFQLFSYTLFFQLDCRSRPPGPTLSPAFLLKYAPFAA